MSEYEYLNHIRALAAENRLFRTYIGTGYYNTLTPAVILRCMFENPGWYTPYTPYQSEVAQGRLESLLTFQTMIIDLTGMEVANASLLDESTAAAEAMTMLFHTGGDGATGKNKFFVSDKLFPQNIDVLKTRAKPIGIDLVVGDLHKLISTKTASAPFSNTQMVMAESKITTSGSRKPKRRESRLSSSLTSWL